MPMVWGIYRVKLCSCFACVVYSPWELVGGSSVCVREQEGADMGAPGDLEVERVMVVLLTSVKLPVIDAS